MPYPNIRVTKPAFNLREKLYELDYKQVPYEKMPPGSVIQVKANHRQNGTYSSGSNSAYTNVEGMNVYFYPRFANSLIVIQANINSVYLNLGGTSGAYHNFRITKTIDGVETRCTNHSSPNVDAEMGRTAPGTGFHASRCLIMTDEPMTTGQVFYKLQHKDGTSTHMDLLYNDTGSTSTFVVWEIRQ